MIANRTISRMGTFFFLLAVGLMTTYGQDNRSPSPPAAPDTLGQEPKGPEPKPGMTQAIEAPEVDDQSIKLFLDKIEVEGKLEKPQAVFIIPGTSPMIDDIHLERSFFDEIFRPVEKKGRAIVRPVAKPKVDRKDVIPW